MSAIFPGRIFWLANNSRSFGFYRDALDCINSAPEFKEGIEFLVRAHVDTINLESADLTTMLSFQRLAEAVIAMNERLQGSNFGDIEYFPSYMEHLLDLRMQIRNSIELLLSQPGASSPPG